MAEFNPSDFGFRMPKDEEAERLREHDQRIASAYETVFGGPLGEIILADLHDFIRPDSPVMAIAVTPDGQAQDLDPSGRITAYNDGSRRVWLHIQERRIQARSRGPRVRVEEESPDETGSES